MVPLAARRSARTLRLAVSALVIALASQLSWACLTLGDAEDSPASGGAGTGGTDLGDAPWGSGGAGGSSGAAGSGGFVPGACDTCGDAGGCECVPDVGQGWAHVRVADSQLTKCPGGTAAPLLVGTGAVDTGCGSCQCGAANDAQCGFALVWYGNASCTTTGMYSGVKTNIGACNTFGNNAGVMAKAFGSGGSCDIGTAPPKAPAFATPKTLCTQPPSGACGSAGSCLAKATSAFDPQACVMFESQGVDVACPAGYPNKLPFSTGFDDTRKCKCSCKPSVFCSGGSVTFDCAAGATNEANQCKDGTGGGSYKILGLPSVSDGSCGPDGAATPSGGSVVASGLRVVCCR